MRSVLTQSLFFAAALGTLALAGCAANVDKNDGTENVAGATDDLSKLGKSLVGTFDYDVAASTADFYSTLSLASDGSYHGIIKPYCPAGTICPLYMIDEKGTWKVTSAHGGTLTLETDLGARKVYGVSSATDGITLTQGKGSEHLTREPATAHLGEHCGGNMATAKKCDAGLVCFGGPLVGDVGGTCMKPVAAGGSCGFRTQNAPCADGLECKHVSGPLDALTCVAPAPTCPSGQHLCAAYADKSGTCHPAYCLFMGAMCLTGPAC